MWDQEPLEDHPLIPVQALPQRNLHHHQEEHHRPTHLDHPNRLVVWPLSQKQQAPDQNQLALYPKQWVLYQKPPAPVANLNPPPLPWVQHPNLLA